MHPYHAKTLVETFDGEAVGYLSRSIKRRDDTVVLVVFFDDRPAVFWSMKSLKSVYRLKENPRYDYFTSDRRIKGMLEAGYVFCPHIPIQ